MSYEVVEYFEDLQDNGHPYNIGDAFPRKGMKVSEERIKELSTIDNLREIVLIREVVGKVAPKKEEPVEEQVEKPKKRSTKRKATS